jgi:hypothetical protein
MAWSSSGYGEIVGGSVVGIHAVDGAKMWVRGVRKQRCDSIIIYLGWFCLRMFLRWGCGESNRPSRFSHRCSLCVPHGVFADSLLT